MAKKEIKGSYKLKPKKHGRAIKRKQKRNATKERH